MLEACANLQNGIIQFGILFCQATLSYIIIVAFYCTTCNTDFLEYYTKGRN